MRAKLRITSVEKYAGGHEVLNFCGVCKKGTYPADGTDEDNTLATYSPSVSLKMTVTNPAPAGKFNPEDTFYVDFTPVPVE